MTSTNTNMEDFLTISIDTFFSYAPSFLNPSPKVEKEKKSAAENEGRQIAPKIHLPYISEYIGPVSLDVLIFVGSAITYRIYIFWRRRFHSAKAANITNDVVDDERAQEVARQRARTSQMIQKAKTYKDRKDPGLYEVMDQCVETKRSLRKVVDPEIARREKMRKIRLNKSSQGYLGMSPENLQSKRQGLKRTGDIPVYPKE